MGRAFILASNILEEPCTSNGSAADMQRFDAGGMEE